MQTSSDAAPEVSVVIPAWNEARYVRVALESVASQTAPLERIEAVVVDNGSTDATGDAVRAFARERPDLRVRLIQEPVAARARAKNIGAAAARGRLVLFLDADSRMAPDLVARVLRRAADPSRAGSIRIVADSRDPLDRGFFGLMEFGKRLFGIRAQMLYCERELFAAHGGFDEALQIAEDREFLVRLQRAHIDVAHLSESWIATSPRRLHALPLRLGIVTTFGRWALAHAGIGRRWRY